MSDSSEDAMDLQAMKVLESLRELEGPDAAASERVHQRLVVGLGLLAVPSPVAAPSSLAPTASAKLGLAASAKLGVVAFALASGLVSYLLRDDGPQSAPAASEVVAAVPSATIDPEAQEPAGAEIASDAAVPEVDAPRQEVVPQGPTRTPSFDHGVSTLAEERMILDAARQAMLAENFAIALEQTRLHRRRFARGRLAEERDALEIHLALRSSKSEQARAAFQRFSKRYPKSIYLRSLKPAIDELSVTEVLR